ncbi:YceD family protein [Parvularcula maris]|uniref:DUF177 domain-containing protein n=1 Tax=Parvularcula maris TaxID=2965077 RepID=A0A9X2RJ82_9PROT|nr:DUF177 domain-containing protein [Parvularcula maris]MCQ8185671.1 DUF177 domain-containing protein [Parvularcula maris]
MQPSNDHLLTRLVRLDEFGSEAYTASLVAGETELKAIAERLDIENAKAFAAELSITRRDTLIRIEGSIRGDLGRTCVVSLEPMRETIEEDFTAEYITEAGDEREGEFEADLDAPEPLEGDTLNLWDVALEQLVLSMSAHPRIEGAEAPKDPGAGARISPFDALKGLT